MITRQTANNEGVPMAAWALILLAALTTVVRIILSLLKQDQGWLETVQVVLIFVALLYVLFVNYPRYKNSVSAAERVSDRPRDPIISEFFSGSTGSSAF